MVPTGPSDTSSDSRYHKHGVSFEYPKNWELTESVAEDEVTVTVTSDETSFWALSLLLHGPDPAQTIEAAIDAYRLEYDDMDVYTESLEVCQRPTTARTIEFVCFDLTNSAFVRAFRTGNFTALIIFQATDRELHATRNQLDRITSSLRIDGDEHIFTVG